VDEFKQMTANFQRPILGASVVVFNRGRALLIKRGKSPGKGLWSLPGGRVEFGETTKAAAAREVLEETGIIVQIEALVGNYEIMLPDNHFVVACFVARTEYAEVLAASDAEEAKFFALGEIAWLKLAPNVLQAIEDASLMIGV
jgi:8-oxo-dGTP diphosphatase